MNIFPKYRKQGENKFADEMKATYARQGKDY